ncbi:MAG: hypothetical protein JO254_09680 [Pseudolabrys sp.]|nr:hypothetical protein [Pseudolabrys sp.]
MPPKDPQKRRPESSAPPDSVTPKSDALPGDLRRSDSTAVAPDTLPEIDADAPADEDIPLAAHRPSEDGGASQHPIHDDDPGEDFTPGDFEEQIDEVADARKGRRARDIAAKN